MKINRDSIFLIDGIGAAISFALLWILIINFYEIFGFPIEVAKRLSLMPLIFSIYSISCYLWKPLNWQYWLRGIAIANLLYCTVSLWLLTKYFEQLTIYGILYFVIEKIIIIPLAWLELKMAKSNVNE
jgi:hypothetical protein